MNLNQRVWLSQPSESTRPGPGLPAEIDRPCLEPIARVCVNQRLFITNTGPPRGVYTCPHKVGYDVTLSLLKSLYTHRTISIASTPSHSPSNPFCSLAAAVGTTSSGCVNISGVSTKCPRSLTSLGSIASKFKTAVGKIAGGGPGVQLSLPVVVSCVHGRVLLQTGNSQFGAPLLTGASSQEKSRWECAGLDPSKNYF
eukprot:COSAG01_NODE_514_length_16043_cov_248.614212_21_plen_198_part_00